MTGWLRTTLATGLLLSVLTAQDDAVRGAIASLLRDGDEVTHCDALTLLARGGARAEPAIPIIAELVGDARPRVRHAAVAALITLAPHAGRAIPILIAHLDAPDSAVRNASRAALDVVAVQRRRSIDEHRDALGSGDLERQRTVLAAMRTDTADARAVLPDLIARLAVESGQFLFEAQSLVRDMATSSHTAELVTATREAANPRTRDILVDLMLQVSEADADDDHGLDALLLELASDTSPLTSGTALRALADRAVYRPALIPRLLAIYDGGDQNRRATILNEWSRSGVGIEDSIDFLARHLRDRDHFWSLSRIVLRAGSAAAPLVPTLADLLARGDRYAAPIAAETLAGLGPHAAAAVESLLAGSMNPDPSVASRCLDALTWIPCEAAPREATLRRAMLHEHADVRVHALAAMVICGDVEATLALALVDALDDVDFEVRSVARSLVPLGGPQVREIVARGMHPSPEARAALQDLSRRFADDGNPTSAALREAAVHAVTPVRSAALAILEHRSTLTATELDLVRSALGSRDAALVARAARVVTATRPAAELVVPLLAPWLESNESLARDASREAITALGDSAESALVDLLARRRHSAAILALFAASAEVPSRAWPSIEDACASSDIRTRAAARRVLARHAGTAPPPRLAISSDQLRRLRERLEVAVRNPRESIEELLALTQDSPVSIRAGALRAMYRIAGNEQYGAHIVAAAADGLRTAELELVDAAAMVLRAARTTALAPLLRLVCEGDTLLRARAGLLARDCDPRGTLPLPDHVWRRLLETDSSSLRIAAMQSAASVDPSTLRPLLVKLLDDPDQAIRWFAFALLERVGAPPELLDHLEAIALHGTEPDCERAAAAIATIQPEGVDVLLRVAVEAAPAARRGAFHALGAHAARARGLFEHALAALSDTDVRTVEAAARLLVAMDLDPHAESAPRLLDAFLALTTRPDRLRGAAILAEAIGPAAAGQWNAFETLSRSTDYETRTIAIRAMLATAAVDSPLEASLVIGPRLVPWALSELPGRADPTRIVNFLLPHVATIDGHLAYLLGQVLVRALPSVDVELEAQVIRAVLDRIASDPAAFASPLAPAITAANRTAADLVADLARDPDARHAELAIAAVARRSPTIVGSWLGSDGPEIDRRILAAIAQIDGHDDERAPVLARWATAADPQSQRIAFGGLGGCGRAGAHELVELCGGRTPTRPIDESLIQPLLRLGDEAELFAPVVLAALRNGGGDRDLLLRLLAFCGPRGIAGLEVLHAAGEEVVDLIALGLDARGPRTRIAALRATLAVRPGFEAVGGAVVVSLHHEDPEVRTWAAIALCGIAHDHQEAQPALRRVLAFPDPALRARAIGVFRVVELPLDLALLVEALDDPDAAVRRAAATAIAKLGPDAAPCRVALRERLQDQDPDVRHAALDALRRIGG